MYNNSMRNLEIPENLFSNLGVGDFSNKKVAVNPHNEKKEFYSSKMGNDLKLVNYSLKDKYRDRINKMYEEINVKPIDNEIDDVLYFNNYIEKGIVVKPKVSSLKQFWTEYRLIDNEKMSVNIKKSGEYFADFDSLFEALSVRITEINRYIDELKEMKSNIVITTNKLAEDREKLSNERREFNSYREKEECKLQEEKESLKINFSKLQTIIDDLDKKLGDLNN